MSVSKLKFSLFASAALVAFAPLAAHAQLSFLVGNQQSVGLVRATVTGNTVSSAPVGTTANRWINGMTRDASNNIWFVGGTDTAAVLGRIDPITGNTISQTVTPDAGYGILGISFAPNGTLYAVRDEPSGPNSLGTLDPVTGAFTLIGSCNYADDIAFVGNTLYSMDRNWGLCTLSLTTGTATDINPSVGGNGQRGMTYYNGVMYLCKTGLETINLTTGVTTTIGTNAELGNLQGGIVFSAVPTPGAAALMGLGGLALARRRR
jgi:MYXO-CTERM domain-containing protein